MTIKSIWLRRIHKWVGLAIGLQFVLWTVSGAAMALLDMETVAGGPRPQAIQSALAGEASGWPAIVGQLDRGTIEGLRLKTLLERPVVEVRSPGAAKVLTERSLPVRDHEPAVWRVDFADDDASTYYVSATTGAVLERRNDTWRWWDFFWMLHNMDYADRTSFNHPLVITAGIAMAWLAVTGFWLLFRTMWRHDFVWIRIGRRDHQH